MSISGLCTICEAAPAADTCQQCGAFVCEQHFDREMHLCQTCAAQAKGR